MNPTQIINEIAKRIASIEGFMTTDEHYDHVNSENPRSKMWVAKAEAAYEVITGDTPDYAEE